MTVLGSSFVAKLEDWSLVNQPDKEVVKQGVEVDDPHHVLCWSELPHDLLLLSHSGTNFL